MRIALIAALAVIAGSAFAAPRAAAPAAPGGNILAPAGPESTLATVPGAGLRTVRVLQYTMDGRIRPLLFWFGRDDIGLARVVWREGDPGTRGYELLVGTDPKKAPRALNRWGYIAEEVQADHGTLLALMTGSDEASYDEAAESAARGATGRDFRAIRSELQGTTATWQIARVESAADLTVHDVDTTLDRVHQEIVAARRGERLALPGSRSGFLVALAELIDRGSGAAAGRAGPPSHEPVRFVFGQSAYELKLRDTGTGSFIVDGQSIPVRRSSFEIRTVSTDARTRFEVSLGTTGRWQDVPVAIEWQPRWWLKVALRLAPTATSG